VEKFSARLKNLREERGLSLMDLSKEVNISDSSLSRWENEKADVKGVYLISLAKFFKVSTDYLLGLED
jgi:transcriptional regulator with XRE-family HTH domain